METQDSVLDVVHPVQSTVDNHRALFSHDPEQAYMEAQRLVNVVASRCTGPGYLVDIKGRNYPKIEWWSSVSSSLGIFPRVLYSKRLDRDDEIAYEAKVEVHRNGQIIASGEAMCSNREDRWRNADEYAIKSMSITRASGKAYRIPLSFLAVMAGLEVTPAEEMPTETAAPPPNNDRYDESKSGHVIPPRNQEQPATLRQLEKLEALVLDRRLNNDERTKLKDLLGQNPSKARASKVMSYFFGQSRLQDGGEWVKINEGVLAQR